MELFEGSVSNLSSPQSSLCGGGGVVWFLNNSRLRFKVTGDRGQRSVNK